MFHLAKMKIIEYFILILKKNNLLIEPTKPLLVVSSMTVPTQMVILNGLVSQYSKVMWSVIWIEVPILLPPMHLRLL